ncbi:MAG: right-handed parallel beta-helix repeat-containing protein [Planctomycetes bacterium]|nr:right-handed parallel beta-helix repeat-containing protein [Planctomycetota bacterium]
MNTRSTRILVLSAVAALAGATANAANVVVQKNGQYPTIQDGINAAGAGGTVTVKAGVYEETPNIASSLDGLTLKASGTVIIDARLANGGADGPGLIVSGDDVVVRGITIRHALNAGGGKPGAGVHVKGVRVRLEKLRVVNASEYGVYVEQTDAVIKNCRFEGCVYGIYAPTGARLLAEGCVIDGAVSSAIFASGDDIVARKNAITSCGTGISLSGMRPHVESNALQRIDNMAIQVGFSDAIVRGNKITSVFAGGGITASGDDSEITSNTIVDVRADGINISGSNTVIAKNKVLGVGSFEDGIYVSGMSPTIESNVLRDIGGNGIYAFSSNMTVKKNVVLRCGRIGSASSAFYLGGTSVDVLANTAKDGHGDGFRLSLQQSDVIGNSAIGNAIDGFDMDVLGTVSKNVALKNWGEGFRLGNANMVFTNNVAKNNRIDVAATAAPQSFQANAYGTGGVNTPPEID